MKATFIIFLITLAIVILITFGFYSGNIENNNIFCNYENGKLSFSIETNWNIFLIIFIFIIFIFLFAVLLFKKRIIFKENYLVVNFKFFGITIFSKKYEYDNIYKIIIGRFQNTLKTNKYHYSIYLDNNDKIIKLLTFSSYKGCLGIIDEIDKKFKKRIYDDTDMCYLLEEDLFRNYYKLKKTFEEIKNE